MEAPELDSTRSLTKSKTLCASLRNGIPIWSYLPNTTVSPASIVPESTAWSPVKTLMKVDLRTPKCARKERVGVVAWVFDDLRMTRTRRERSGGEHGRRAPRAGRPHLTDAVPAHDPYAIALVEIVRKVAQHLLVPETERYVPQLCLGCGVTRATMLALGRAVRARCWPTGPIHRSSETSSTFSNTTHLQDIPPESPLALLT